MTDLGRERDASRQYISKVLRDVWHEIHGAVPPRLQPTEQDAALRQQVASLHLDGITRKQIADRLDIQTRLVTTIIATEGLPDHICPICRKPAPKRRKYCDACRDHIRRTQLRIRAANMRVPRRNLNAAGLCHACGQPTGDGQTKCPKCRFKKADCARNRLRQHNRKQTTNRDTK